MLTNFLPSQVNQPKHPKAIAFGQSIERIALATSLSQHPILTTEISFQEELLKSGLVKTGSLCTMVFLFY
ncbi:hypothetical protein [uncultured Nostoc sp.]|uniref:hypothetical protein n=1 Tax=uncultured Nostoc sp. TaxID=340711 RepID=UPI00260758E0|nr:hypothetical protein [uncultured Nostoc sp.]